MFIRIKKILKKDIGENKIFRFYTIIQIKNNPAPKCMQFHPMYCNFSRSKKSLLKDWCTKSQNSK